MNATKQAKAERKVSKAFIEGAAAFAASSRPPRRDRGAAPRKSRAEQSAFRALSGNARSDSDQYGSAAGLSTDKSSRVLLDAIGAAGAGSSSGQFRRLAMSMCLPSVSSPVRASVGVASRPTAVATPFEKKTLVLANGSQSLAGNGGSNDAAFIASFRQFSRANVTQQLVTGFTDFTAFSNQGGGLGLFNEEGSIPIHFLADQLTAGSTPSIHGPTLFALLAPGENRDSVVWLDSPLGTSTIGLTVNVGAEIQVRKWLGDTFTTVLSIAATGAPQSLNLSSGSGYYSISLEYNGGGNDGTPLALEFRMQYGSGAIGTAPTYGYAHTVLPGLFANLPAFSSGRILAVSLMLSNYSAAIAKRGRLVGWAAPNGTDWTQFAAPLANFLGSTPNPYDKLASMQDMTELKADDGMYGFLLPCDNDAMNLVTLQDTVAGTTSDPRSQFALEPLIGKDGFLMFVLDASMPSAVGVVDDRMFVRSSFYHFEGMTGDPWRTTAFSNCPPSLYLDDLALLRKIPLFYSNAWHLADIARKISNVAGWAQPFLTSMGMAGGPYGTPLLALGNAAGAINGLGKAFLPKQKRVRRPRGG